MEHSGHEYQLCGFKLGKVVYAIPLLKVRELLQPCEVTPIPRSPGYIGGLINYRGKIVVTINVRGLLGAQSTFVGKPMNIIVDGDDSLCCLEVDEVVDIIDVRGRALNEIPGNINKKMKFFIMGIYRLDNDLAILLDLDRILNLNRDRGS